MATIEALYREILRAVEENSVHAVIPEVTALMMATCDAYPTKASTAPIEEPNKSNTEYTSRARVYLGRRLR